MTAPTTTLATALQVRNVSVRFGGLVAVNDVSLAAPINRITGLIGPNGAGKSTIFNACTGLVTPSAGRIHIFDHDVTSLPPARRARLGLARTFQRMQLYDSLTVRENVRMGLEAAFAGRSLLSKVWESRSEREAIAEAADVELERCGLTALAARPAGALSTGQRRLVELARALVSPARLLLLDEPSSGLDKSETERFGKILAGVAAQREVAILLVEHDMDLVASSCEWVYVLEFGTLIFEGSVADVLTSDAVRQAYLGEGDADA
ncbi:MAG: ABC transporter ATP-binding protein [Acidimicrobiales bacterium]